MRATKIQFHNAKAVHEKIKEIRKLEYKLDLLSFDNYEIELKQYTKALNTLYDNNYGKSQ